MQFGFGERRSGPHLHLVRCRTLPRAPEVAHLRRPRVAGKGRRRLFDPLTISRPPKFAIVREAAAERRSEYASDFSNCVSRTNLASSRQRIAAPRLHSDWNVRNPTAVPACRPPPDQTNTDRG